MIYSAGRIVVCRSMCHFVNVFFSPFSIAITSLGEERANLNAFRTFVRFVLVWICRFPLPLGVLEGLRFVIVAFPGLFSYLSFRSIGIPGELLKYFLVISLVVNNFCLAGSRIQMELYQGRRSSKINPLTTSFLMFINEIITEIGSSIRLFADDTSLSILVDNPDVAAEILNADLEKIAKWAEAWLEKINPLKN